MFNVKWIENYIYVVQWYETGNRKKNSENVLAFCLGKRKKMKKKRKFEKNIYKKVKSQ